MSRVHAAGACQFDHALRLVERDHLDVELTLNPLGGLAPAAPHLEHTPGRDLGDGLEGELARVLRPGARLVAVTNTQLNLPELWSLFGERAERVHGFNAENGEEILRRHFASVTRRDARGTIRFPDRDAALRYVKASTTRSRLAEDLPDWDGPLDCTRFSAVFVAEKL